MPVYSDDTFPCPHCGAPVATGATFCRECGADDAVGWNDSDDVADDYGDDDFDYDDYVRREFPDQAEPTLRGGFRTLVIVLVCVMLLLLSLLV